MMGMVVDALTYLKMELKMEKSYNCNKKTFSRLLQIINEIVFIAIYCNGCRTSIFETRASSKAVTVEKKSTRQMWYVRPGALIEVHIFNYLLFSWILSRRPVMEVPLP